jgi:hypothetical protein
MPEVILRLCGGLGNQLFQYAAGRRMADQSGWRVLYDCHSEFQNDGYNRAFELDWLIPAEARLEPERAADREGLERGLMKAEDLVARVTGHYWWPGSALRWYGSLTGRQSLRLSNYFQDIGYVDEAVLGDIRKGMASRFEAGRIRAELGIAPAARVLAVHVRMGRHRVTSGQLVNAKIAGTNLTLGYFEQATRLAAVRTKPEVLLVLCDCPESQEAFSSIAGQFREGGREVVFAPLAASAWECLSYMALSCGVVMANSTLSVWGAMLSSRAVVTAPKEWRSVAWGRPVRSLYPPNAEIVSHG